MRILLDGLVLVLVVGVRSFLFFVFRFAFESRHLLTLGPGFRLGRGTEEAVGAALARPSEKPRVLVVPQWCVDPPDPPSEALFLPVEEEIPSLGLDDLRRRHGQGTAGLCHLRAADSADQDVWFGAGVMEDVVDCGEGGDEGGLRGAARRRGRAGGEIEDGLALLRSDVASPILVVDMWSAPALFLRHVEVGVVVLAGGVVVC